MSLVLGFASVVAGDRAKEKIGAAFDLLLRGTPLIYYGQELGMRGKQNPSWGTDANDIPVREAFRWARDTLPGSATPGYNGAAKSANFGLDAGPLRAVHRPPYRPTIPRMKTLVSSLLVSGLVAFSAASSFAQSNEMSVTAPKTIIHVVTVSWKPGTKTEQVQAALDGVQKLPSVYQGILHVWTKTIKAQGDRSAAIVMEFANEKAFKDYTNSDAQKEWYKVYLPIRDRSTTFDVSNE